LRNCLKNQSIANLKLGLRRWLQAVESHYGVKPIIPGERYYDDFLKEEFSVIFLQIIISIESK
jgi:lysozyme